MVKILEYKVIYSKEFTKLGELVTEHCHKGFVPYGSFQANATANFWGFFQPMIRVDQSVLTEEDGDTLLEFLKPQTGVSK